MVEITLLKSMLRIVYVIVLCGLDILWIVKTVKRLRQLGVGLMLFRDVLCFIVNAVLLLILTMWTWF